MTPTPIDALIWWKAIAAGVAGGAVVASVLVLVRALTPKCWGCEGRGWIWVEQAWAKRDSAGRLPGDRMWCHWCEGSGRGERRRAS